MHAQVVGTNLGGLAYYSTELVFVDAMKMSSAWISLDQAGLRSGNSPWGNGMPIDLRPDGYPARLQPGQVCTHTQHAIYIYTHYVCILTYHMCSCPHRFW